MGVPEFYFNSLPDYRRDTLEFLLCLSQYVREKGGSVHHLYSALPAKSHPRFSPDIGDAVMYFVYKFSHKMEFAGEINGIVSVLQGEQSTEIPEIRDYVLRLANENLLEKKVIPFVVSVSGVSFGFRDFLLHFVHQYSEANNIKKSYQDKLKNAITSPAMSQLRKVLDFYGLHLNQKEPKSYLKFYACICALLLKIDSLRLDGYVFQVLGEVENVIHKYQDSFPGYVNLDNYAKFKKLLLAGKVQPINE